MNLETIIKDKFVEAFGEIYSQEIEKSTIAIQQTRKEFDGDFTVNVFPYVRFAKSKPEELATKLGEYFVTNVDEIDNYNVIKGFLNLSVADSYWLGIAKEAVQDTEYGFVKAVENEAPIVIEYSSPNTNKPLHLGHIRNNLLGFSIAEILHASGKNVKKVNLVNDRGIHICKSMLAWQKHGNNETPESTGEKGDHLVGKYYVQFDKDYKVEIAKLIAEGKTEKEANAQAPVILEAQQMLRDWEAKEPQVYKLWETMNAWVYKGFDVTYKKMGVDFDKIYYESDTYLLGKEVVMKGFDTGVLYQKEDGSIWADLEDKGLDQKLLLRSDGTSVYMTQDIGTAQLRELDYAPQAMLYVVGNEQNYHFDVLKIVLEKLGFAWSEKIHHISYGMVELPHGKMKSREGTVVDADDLIDGIIEDAKKLTSEAGKIDSLTVEEANHLYYQVGMAALKFFILKVDPKRKMLFNPEESIDFNGNTGPFVQYSYARIQSIMRRAKDAEFGMWDTKLVINNKEKSLLRIIYNYPAVVQSAANNYSPAMIASYAFDLAKEYNQFYHDNHIMNETDKNKAAFRLDISKLAGNIIKSSMALLGIEVPNQM
ncbi:MAG: arginine--tRNA ligase [Bacteroidales bacterium]|nr:arginine--tRNA ligase [Bacteroidales bacterium]